MIDTGMSSGKCLLLGGLFSTLVQVSLGVICILALVIKRNNEIPRRDWDVWFLDVMKQGTHVLHYDAYSKSYLYSLHDIAIGSGFGHFANIFLSMFIAGTITDADECQWYCLTYVVDSTLGTFMNILLLRCFERCLLWCPGCTVLRFGDYGTPPQLLIWFPQLVVWMIIVVIAKILTMFLLFQFLAPLDVIISTVFKIFTGYPELELVTVMVIIPTIMNTVQFWVTDTFLKRKVEEEVRDSELDEELITGVCDCVLAVSHVARLLILLLYPIHVNIRRCAPLATTTRTGPGRQCAVAAVLAPPPRCTAHTAPPR
jgi:hypothetical protein